MKKLVLLIVCLTIIQIISVKSQNSGQFNFKSFGLVYDLNDGRVLPVNDTLRIEKFENKYQITSFDVNHIVGINIMNVKYVKKGDISQKYIYVGDVEFGSKFRSIFGARRYGCVIKSLTKLSDFTKGDGNTDNFMFDRVFEITIIYGNKEIGPDYYNSSLAIYPINK